MLNDLSHIPYPIRHLASLDQEHLLLVLLLVPVPAPLVDLRRGQLKLNGDLLHEVIGPIAMLEVETHQLVVLFLSLHLVRALALLLLLDSATRLHEAPAGVKAQHALLRREEVGRRE